MIHTPVDAITKADIDALVAGGVAEGRTIEYKLELPGGNDEARKEFLADVSSFANASGGDLIYGVAAKDGIPTAVPGIPGITADAEKLRLEEMIRTGIEPRIVGLRIGQVDGFAGPVLLLRIPQSFNAPHMISFKKSSRFFTRNSAGKYQMDVAELRLAFDASGSISKRLENMRMDRLAKIIAGEVPVSIPSNSFLILHVMPLPSFALNSYLNRSFEHILLNSFCPMSGSLSEFRHNLDGFVTSSARGHPEGGYCQFFRTGMLEAVWGELVRTWAGNPPGVASSHYEERLMAASGRYLAGLKTLQVPLPLHLTVSLIGVKGAHLWTGGTLGRGEKTFDRDSILLPGVMVEEYETASDLLLRPVLDAMWNAAGFERCLNYDESGKWKKPN